MRWWLLLALVCFPFSIKSAEAPAASLGIVDVVNPTLRLGLQTGLGMFDAWLTRNSFLMGPGFGYGVIGKLSVDLRLSRDLYLSSGVMYAPRNISVNQSGTMVKMTRKTAVIPVLVKYSLLPLITVFGGIYTGIALGEWTYDPPNPAETADLHTFDAGPAIGMELRYPLSFSKTQLWELIGEFSYYWGVTNQARSPVEDFRYRTMHFLFGISLGV